MISWRNVATWHICVRLAFIYSFRINDVGGSKEIGGWEEIDEGQAGADYGWNLCEGTHDNPERRGNVGCVEAPPTPPIYEYSYSSTGCESITAGAFVPDGSWPPSTTMPTSSVTSCATRSLC